MIYYWLILPSIPSSSEWSISGFPTKTFHALLFSFMCATCPAYPFLLDLFIIIKCESNYEASYAVFSGCLPCRSRYFLQHHVLKHLRSMFLHNVCCVWVCLEACQCTCIEQVSYRSRLWECIQSPAQHMVGHRFVPLFDFINKQPIFSVFIAPSFSTCNFAFLFDNTVLKSNIIRMICCGFVVVGRMRSEGEAIILSLYICLVMLRYIPQLLKCWQYLLHS